MYLYTLTPSSVLAPRPHSHGSIDIHYFKLMNSIDETDPAYCKHESAHSGSRKIRDSHTHTHRNSVQHIVRSWAIHPINT